MDMTRIMSSLMVVSSAPFIVPSVLYSTSTPKSLETSDHILVLSYSTSIILLIFYFIYLHFQLYTHAHHFGGGDQVDVDESPEIGPWAAIIVLVIANVGVSFCSDYLIDNIDETVKASHVSRTFIGLIILPIVGNAGQYVTTVNAATSGGLDLAICVMVGCTLQIAYFITPFLVILAG